MPTTYAHYRLGIEVIKRLPVNIRDGILQNRELFDIGVHGPDLLFYYNPLCHNTVGKLGTRIHEEPGRTFFIKAAASLHKNNEKEAHLSYIYGYLCHFALDYMCHGYVAEQMEDKGLSHYEIESEYDRRLLEKDGYANPLLVCVTKHLKASKKNAEIIGDFYDGISVKKIKRSIQGMIFFLNVLRTPTKAKRRLVALAMKTAGIYDNMKGLLMNERENPLCRMTTDGMEERFEPAVKLATELILEYEIYVKKGGKLSDTFSYNFESQPV